MESAYILLNMHKMPHLVGTEPTNLQLKHGASRFKHLESLSLLSLLMLSIWKDFGKRLQICTHHNCHVMYMKRMHFVGSLPIPTLNRQTYS